MKAFANLAVMLMASAGIAPALAHQQQDLTRSGHMRSTAAQNTVSEARLIELVELCIDVVDRPERAKHRLRFAGWSDLGPDQDVHPVYQEAGAGLLKKGPATLMFVSRDTSLGRENPDVDYPVCEATITDPQLSLDGASKALAMRFGEEILTHDPEDADQGTQHVFVANGRAISVADLVNQPGALQIMIIPEPLDIENPE